MLKIIIIALVLSFCNCLIFSSFQTAKTLDSGIFEIQPSYSVSLLTEDIIYLEKVSTSIGFQIGYGLSDRITLQGKYVFSSFPISNEQYDNYFEIEPKFEIVRKKHSFSLPIGYYIHNVYQFTPTLYSSWLLTPALDITIASRLIGLLIIKNNYSNVNGSLIAAVNICLAIHPFKNNIEIRPEIGFALSKLQAVQFGVGLVFPKLGPWNH